MGRLRSGVMVAIGVGGALIGCRRHESEPAPVAGEVGVGQVLRATRVTASSSHPRGAGYTFVATNLIDGSLSTSWQPARSERGSPLWVRLEFDSPVTVTSVGIANGFQTKDRFGDEFLLNRRIATGRLRFEDASELPIRFAEDARGYVRFAVPRKATRTVELVVDEMFAGSKWSDLAVSEIEVTGLAHVQASEPVASAVIEAPEPAAEDWWTPPADERISVEAPAHAFAGIDEKDLGSVFTNDLKPVYGAPSLFEERPPRRVREDRMQHVVVKLRDSSQLESGFQFLFIGAGMHYSADHDYVLSRAMQVHEVVRVDESARMRRPPENAVLYLAEVHRGASFDLLVEGEHSAMGAQLDLLFTRGGGSAKQIHESSRYRLKAFGLGLQDVNRDGIFAMSAEEIAQRYQVGAPVPVQLVFRTIPGRVYRRRELEIPAPVIDEAMFAMAEGERRWWRLQPGRYSIEATSKPNGFALTWSNEVDCDQDLGRGSEYKLVKMSCTLRGASDLELANPSALGMGPTETMSLYVSRQP